MYNVQYLIFITIYFEFPHRWIYLYFWALKNYLFLLFYQVFIFKFKCIFFALEIIHLFPNFVWVTLKLCYSLAYLIYLYLISNRSFKPVLLNRTDIKFCWAFCKGTYRSCARYLTITNHFQGKKLEVASQWSNYVVNRQEVIKNKCSCSMIYINLYINYIIFILLLIYFVFFIFFQFWKR